MIDPTWVTRQHALHIWQCTAPCGEPSGVIECLFGSVTAGSLQVASHCFIALVQLGMHAINTGPALSRHSQRPSWKPDQCFQRTQILQHTTEQFILLGIFGGRNIHRLVNSQPFSAVLFFSNSSKCQFARISDGFVSYSCNLSDICFTNTTISSNS